MLNPPIKNLGVKGIKKTAGEIKKWPKILDGFNFKMSIFVHIGGTGGGIFRYMYSKFLKEAAVITSNKNLLEISDMIKNCGDLWTEVALPLKTALDLDDPTELLKEVPEKLNRIADEESEVFTLLAKIVNS